MMNAGKKEGNMGTFLYWVIEFIAKMHSKILSLNDAYEYHFTDKESEAQRD